MIVSAVILAITSLLVKSTLSNKTFPQDFKFGVATSSFQVEGAWNTDGKGPSIWDHITHIDPKFIDDAKNADIACDSYHKFREDVQLVKNLGVNWYRISISWPRIFPYGFTTQRNEAGVQYYNQLIDEIVENNLEPMVTLYHWDLPQMFNPLGSWTNPLLVQLFADYSREVFKLFGDRVKLWLTFNEPRLVCQHFKASAVNFSVPFYPVGVVEYMCVHNLLKAHAEAYHIYQKEFKATQRGKISYTLDFVWTEPASDSVQDQKVAEQRREFDFGIYANPVFNFDYPQVVIDRVAHRSRIEGFTTSRLPAFTMEEKLRIRGTYDFLGINFYIGQKARWIPESTSKTPDIELDAGGVVFYDPQWQNTSADWIKITPWFLRQGLAYLKKTYRNPDIIITESGFGDTDGKIEDNDRISYLQKYFQAALDAIYLDRVNLKGFVIWSLMDNFEWTNGYTLKFGLYQVDFDSANRTRTPKKSVEFIRNLTASRSL